MKFYHATTLENAEKISEEKVIRCGCDGLVYLCKDPIDACKFLFIRLIREARVIEVDLDAKDVEESFDHSQTFFMCKAYMHKGDIKLTGMEKAETYTWGKS